MNLEFCIITPQRTALEAEVLSIHLPGLEGEMEVFPMHADIIVGVDHGELKYRLAGSKELKNLFIGGGYLQVEKDKALLVTDIAVEAKEIDTKTVEQAIERAKDALRNKSSVLSREEETYLENCITQQIAMLDFRKRRR